jgi:hypothetical protein
MNAETGKEGLEVYFRNKPPLFQHTSLSSLAWQLYWRFQVIYPHVTYEDKMTFLFFTSSGLSIGRVFLPLTFQ